MVNGVASEGGDGTSNEVARHALAFRRVVLLEYPNSTLATLRNVGLPHCTGDIVALTDDDAVPDVDWVAAIARAHASRTGRSAIGGSVRGLRAESLVSRVADVVVFPDPPEGRTLHTLPTVNMTYSRHLMASTGEFDPSLFRGEDVDFNWRVFKSGTPIVFESSIRVRHEHRITISGLYKQQYMYGRAYVLVRRKWPDMYAVYPRRLETARDWAKLVHAALAIFYQPFQLVVRMPSRGDWPLAYPTLVGHHAIWKTGMLYQALLANRSSARHRASHLKERPRVRSWIDGIEASSASPWQEDDAID